MWKIIAKQPYDSNIANPQNHQDSIKILMQLTQKIIAEYSNYIKVNNMDFKNTFNKIQQQLDLGVMFNINDSNLSPFVYKNDVIQYNQFVNNEIQIHIEQLQIKSKK